MTALDVLADISAALEAGDADRYAQHYAEGPPCSRPGRPTGAESRESLQL
jgi:hypothetical protein